MPGKTPYGKSSWGLRPDGTRGPINKNDPAYQHPNPAHRTASINRGVEKVRKNIHYG
jgi:hypothetical protein